jgi:hypothetical protein
MPPVQPAEEQHKARDYGAHLRNLAELAQRDKAGGQRERGGHESQPYQAPFQEIGHVLSRPLRDVAVIDWTSSSPSRK